MNKEIFNQIGKLLEEQGIRIYNSLPEGVKALIAGLIAQAAIGLAGTPGSDKRMWVSQQLSNLTNLPEGIWHSVVHVAFTKAEPSITDQNWVLQANRRNSNPGDAVEVHDKVESSIGVTVGNSDGVIRSKFYVDEEPEPLQAKLSRLRENMGDRDPVDSRARPVAPVVPPPGK